MPETITYASVNDGRAAAALAHSAWWTLYKKNPDSEDTRTADAKSKEIRDAVLAQYGVKNPAHPDCQQCLAGSVFGGPRHEASPRCRSGKRPHCSCDACF